MPEFMDVHKSMKGVTPEQLMEAHNADLAIQDEEGANFKHAWGDPMSGMVFCLSEAPRACRSSGRRDLRGAGSGLTVQEVPVQA
jgi:hypothetical protein